MMLVVGLGNPGSLYTKTRHNVGFLVIDRLAVELGLTGWRLKCKALVAEVCLQEQKVILAKPQTYMNNSGEAVKPLLRWYGLDLTELMVICDDLDLPLGRIRIRKRGGDGGHRGLKSIIEALGNNEFTRLRIGIGRPQNTEVDPVQWVLGRISTAEVSVLSESLARAAQAVRVIINEGIEKAMNQFNLC